MGANMAKRLRRADHKVVGFARHASTVEKRLAGWLYYSWCIVAGRSC